MSVAAAFGIGGALLGSYLKGKQTQQRSRHSQSMDNERMELERLRVQDAIDRARESLDMNKEQHQYELQLDKDMRARRRQSPDQLLQSQVSPLGQLGEGPLPPEQYDQQQSAMQLLQEMGPMAQVPLQDQDVFEAIRGNQYGADQRSRMTSPISPELAGVYDADPNMSLQDFLVGQQGMVSEGDEYAQNARMDQLGASNAGGPDRGDITSHASNMHKFYTDGMDQGVNLILHRFPEVQAQIEAADAANPFGRPLTTDQKIALLPQDALMEVFSFAEQYATDRMSSSEELLYGGQGDFGGDPVSTGAGTGDPNLAPNSFGAGAPDYAAMQQQVIEEQQQQRLNAFLAEHPGAMNMPLFQSEEALDYIGRFGDEADLLSLIAELRAMAEARGEAPGEGVQLKRSTKTAGKSRVTKKKPATFADGDYSGLP